MIRTTGIGRRGLLAGASALGAGLLAPASLRAQEAFPSRTIEVVTHAGVGGGTDITARMMMVGAPGEFRQELTVVNRTAGSGAQALQYLASKPADGHTIILMTQTHLLTMLRNRNLPQLTDLIPLARATDAVPDADRALEADGTDAVVEGAAARIAQEFEVFDTGPGFDDEDFAAVVELGEEGDAAGGGGLGR